MAEPTINVNGPRTPAVQAVEAPKGPDFGDGRFTPYMKELYRDSQRLLGLSPKQAEHAARSLGADLGRAKFEPPKVAWGRVTGKGTTSLRDVAVAKTLVVTHAISVAIAVSRLNDLNALGTFRVSADGVECVHEAMAEWLG